MKKKLNKEVQVYKTSVNFDTLLNSEIEGAPMGFDNQEQDQISDSDQFKVDGNSGAPEGFFFEEE